jgi:hypothetical protein
MTGISFMPFREARRERCGLCRQRLALAYLVLIKEGDRVAGELELCARCAALLQEVCASGAANDLFIEEEAGE